MEIINLIPYIITLIAGLLGIVFLFNTKSIDYWITKIRKQNFEKIKGSVSPAILYLLYPEFNPYDPLNEPRSHVGVLISYKLIGVALILVFVIGWFGSKTSKQSEKTTQEEFESLDTEKW